MSILTDLTPEDTVQSRSHAQWTGVVRRQIDEHTADDPALLRWIRQGLSEAQYAVNWENWHPQVQQEVAEATLQILRWDSSMVEACIRFALCSANYWSDERLYRFVCLMAGHQALARYLATLPPLAPLREPTDAATDAAPDAEIPEAPVDAARPGTPPPCEASTADVHVPVLPGEDHGPPAVAPAMPAKQSKRGRRHR